jgi:hypothetical protein
MRAATSRPWYREPWPWLLMAAPAASIVMGITLWVLAARTDDGLVAGDYYKQGLAINQVLDREARAATLRLGAHATFNTERTRIRLHLNGESSLAAAVTLRLVHPTRSGEDQAVALVAVAGGVFEGVLRAPAAGRWRLVLEDTSGAWRLAASWHTQEGTVSFEAQPDVPGRG